MRSPIKFSGIARHAELLGVSRSHLWQVLTGKRKSFSLMARYQRLRAEEASQPTFFHTRKNGKKTSASQRHSNQGKNRVHTRKRSKSKQPVQAWTGSAEGQTNIVQFPPQIG